MAYFEEAFFNDLFKQAVYVENYTRIKKLISFELQNSPQQS